MIYKRLKMLTAIVFFCIILLLIALSYKKVIWQGDIVPGEKPVTNPMKGFVAWGKVYFSVILEQ